VLLVGVFVSLWVIRSEGFCRIAARTFSLAAPVMDKELHVQGAMMTSIVDDTFFVLKQACMRALSTGSMQCFVSTLSLAVGQLTGPFRGAVSEKLPQCPAAVIKLFADGRVPLPAEMEEASAPLNNVVLCTAYVAKMHSSLETQAVQRCGPHSIYMRAQKFKNGWSTSPI
jgi:hypothetical protein